MGKGRNQSATTTVTQQKIPEKFEPYYDRLLTRAEEESTQPYQPYGGQRLAGTTADTQKSYDMVRDVAAKGNQATSGAMNVYQQNLDSANALMGQQPYQFSEYEGFEAGKADPYAGFKETKVDPYTEFSAYKADPYTGFSEADYSEYGFDPTEVLDAAKTSQYMDPYLRNVLDVKKAQAQKDFDTSRGSREAAAIQAGAIGSSRSALMEAVAQGDMLNRMKDIEATGQEQAYQDAVSRFAADRSAKFAREQAAAGEKGRVQTSAGAEKARVQKDQAAELARVQALDAGEFARVQREQAAELARVQGVSVAEASRIQQAEAAELARTQGISIAEASRIQSAKASERSRVQAAQFDANNQAIKTQMEAMGIKGDTASSMAQLGELARTGNIQAAQLMESIGKAQQAQQQAGYDLGYEDFLRQQGWNQNQLGFMSNTLQGLPIAPAGTTSQSTPYNPVQQALGAGISALSLYKGLS